MGFIKINLTLKTEPATVIALVTINDINITNKKTKNLKLASYFVTSNFQLFKNIFNMNYLFKIHLLLSFCIFKIECLFLIFFEKIFGIKLKPNILVRKYQNKYSILKTTNT